MSVQLFRRTPIEFGVFFRGAALSRAVRVLGAGVLMAWGAQAHGQCAPTWLDACATQGLPCTNGELGTGGVFNLATDGDSLFASGWLTFNGEAIDLARFDGSTWHALPAGGPGRVGSMLVQGGRLFVAGSEGSRLASWDGAAWTPLLPAGAADCWALAPVDDDVYVAGAFSTGTVGRISGTRVEPLADGPRGTVNALAAFRGELVAVGAFSLSPPVIGSNMGVWDGTKWERVAGAPDATVWCAAAFKDALVVAGEFTRAGGKAVQRIARWDGATFAPMGDGLNGAVYGLHVHRGELYATGRFTKSGSREMPRIARWDGSAWQPVGAGVGPTGASLSEYGATMTTYKGSLIVGGVFGTAGGVATRDLAVFGRPCNACAADFDNDGAVTFEDFDAFVAALEGGVGTADMNEDGFLGFEDFDAFVEEFETGC